jgi:hypothetical protein
MKVRALLNLTLLLGAAGASLFAIPAGSSIVLYNTGTSGNGAGCIGTSVLSAGCSLAANGDPLPGPWTLTSVPAGGAPVVQAVTSAAGGAPFSGANQWLGNNGTSTWLSPAGGPDVAGFYTYALTFNLDAAQAAKTIVISGRYAADDSSSFELNGNPFSATLQGTNSFGTWTPFVIDQGFVEGLNTLHVTVRNVTTGFTGAKAEGGLRVEFDSVFVPEGGELTGLTLGLGAVLFAWKRKKAASVPAL